MVFGHIPDGYVDYWTSRFPRLLLHSWYAVQCIKTEIIFHKYYDETFNFGPEFSFENHAFVPNIPPWNLSGNSWPSPSSQDAPFQRGTGTNKTQKEKQEEVTPVWIIRKPSNTFEPKYRIPKLRNLDAPWRRQAAEPSTKQVSEIAFDSTSTQVQENPVLGNESKIINTLRIEELSHVSGTSESSEASCEAENVNQEYSEACDDSQTCEHGIKGAEPSENCEAEGKEGPESSQELCENKSGVSQVHLGISPMTQEKLCEPEDNALKFITVSGKKKKSKKISNEKKMNTVSSDGFVYSVNVLSHVVVSLVLNGVRGGVVMVMAATVVPVTMGMLHAQVQAGISRDERGQEHHRGLHVIEIEPLVDVVIAGQWYRGKVRHDVCFSLALHQPEGSSQTDRFVSIVALQGLAQATHQIVVSSALFSLHFENLPALALTSKHV
ncbi:hypothetical protein E2C01_028138 [Portunus trituberculatus]|uniref:KEN domain-containing protein n=1 Tax=Portunus trituberculatus TaxID=210409 RepID=A0A5B7EN87_PORTR|nr:hypothetical protein [Portunus trituberculatus]